MFLYTIVKKLLKTYFSNIIKLIILFNASINRLQKYLFYHFFNGFGKTY